MALVDRVVRLTDRDLRIDDVETARAAERQWYRGDPVTFARALDIPSARASDDGEGPQLFDDVIQPFQRECFERLAPSLLAVRDGGMPPIRRFWIERTKKAGKDSDLAVCLLWLMAFSERPLLVQVCAANQKQAGIIKRRVVDLLHYNLWLNDLVRVQQNRILGAGRLGEVVIEATDATGGAHGETPDLLVLNELVHVAKWSVMETHMNNADGVPRGVAIVSTNAGIKGTKAELWRNNALASPDRWCVMRWSEKSPWLSDEDVEDARRRDPVGSEFARLFRGVWISGRGGAVDEESIDRCFRAEGPLPGPEPGWTYLAGLDLGVSKDHSGLAVLGVNVEEKRLRVVRVEGWEPTMETGGKLEVDSRAVKSCCREVNDVFRLAWFGYDPAAGGSFMAQELREVGLPMRQMSFSTANKIAMANAFVQVIKDGKLECYEDEGGRLRRDFGKFSIVPYPSGGYKLEAVSDEHGHADVGTALVVCLPKAVEMLGGWDRLRPDDSLVYDGGGDPLTDEDVCGMPDGLRDIYEHEEKVHEEARSSRRTMLQDEVLF